MLGVLLAGVLVPTVCVLWFMNAPMRNERLGVRQRLTDVYRKHALEARTSLEGYWSAKAAALDKTPKASGPQTFAALIQAGVADSAIVYDAAGKRSYPDFELAPPRPQDEGKPRWQKAERLEYDLAQPGKAAEAQPKKTPRQNTLIVVCPRTPEGHLDGVKFRPHPSCSFNSKHSLNWFACSRTRPA